METALCGVVRTSLRDEDVSLIPETVSGARLEKLTLIKVSEEEMMMRTNPGWWLQTELIPTSEQNAPLYFLVC